MVAGRPNSTWGGGDGRGIRVVVADRKTVVLITIMLLPKWSAFHAAGNRPEPEASMRKTGIRPVPWKGWDGTLADGDEQGELGEHSRASRRDAAPDRLHQARLQQSYAVRSPGAGSAPGPGGVVAHSVLRAQLVLRGAFTRLRTGGDSPDQRARPPPTRCRADRRAPESAGPGHPRTDARGCRERARCRAERWRDRPEARRGKAARRRTRDRCLPGRFRAASENAAYRREQVISMMYRHGYFCQRLDTSGWQHEYWIDVDP